MYKLVVNKIRCKFCGDIIESRSVHNFVRCRCGKCSTDGGQEYAQRSFFTEKPEDTYEDLSLYVDTETGKIIPAAEAQQEDIPFRPIRIEIKKVEEPNIPENVPVVIPKEDGTHEIKEVDAIPIIPVVTKTVEAEPEDKEEDISIIKEKNGKPISGRYPYGKKK